MKNQPFHPRKIRIPEDTKLDYDQLKSRTIIALNRMGQQRFSSEPGGYSLDNWIRGMNILLDDFEKGTDEEKLSSDYFAKRRVLNELLSKPIPTESIDRDISEIRQKMAETDGRIEAERARIASRIDELKNEQAKCSAELAREQARASNPAAERSSGSFFRRLIGGNSKTSRQNSEGSVEELESRLGALAAEMTERKKLLKSVGSRSPESPVAEEWKVLQALQSRLEELESERSESMQLARVREGITASIAGEISKAPP